MSGNQTGNQTFFQPKLICQFVRIHTNFPDFYLIVDFFFILKKRSKVTKF